MADFSIETWGVVALVTLAAVLAFLHALGAAAHNEVNMHDLQVRIARLRREYYQRASAEGVDILPPGVIEVGPADDDEEPLQMAA